jgi:ubiquinone/menaquinone biosynthesis C-methylase UbiE
MPLSALIPPSNNPAPFFELIRSFYATQLFAAAVVHLKVFERLGNASKPMEDFRQELGLQLRPATVLFTALQAMGMLIVDNDNRIALTPATKEHLVPGGDFYIGDYVALVADQPGVKELAEQLRSNRPENVDNKDRGVAFIAHQGIDSAMDHEASARYYTLALAGRAKCVAPYLAERVSLEDAHTLLDVGGGTGIYSIAFLQKYPQLKAILWDRPEVLKVAHEFAESYGVADRMQFLPGDMFVDPVPQADAILMSNILHDWDIPECQKLIKRCADSLSNHGRLLIHDVFLNDALDGPLYIALYSTALFTLTEGRAYSAAEYRTWLQEAGLHAGEPEPTFIHCGVLEGRKTTPGVTD